MTVGDSSIGTRKSRTLMFQGTASHVGKTVFTAALCRILSDEGYKVAPFKAQNMSLNSYVTPDGREMARAQALQAFIARAVPRVEMNPILLKPSGGNRVQVVLEGRPLCDLTSEKYYDLGIWSLLLSSVRRSLYKLLREYDYVIIEGAGSPAEINLLDRDLANGIVAEMADAPIVLIGDIDRGGVFAGIYGTLKLMPPRHERRVCGFIINKFRGSLSILEPGIRKLERLTGKRSLGVVPYVDNLLLPSEDSVSLEGMHANSSGRVKVIQLPLISNFTDFEPLTYSGIGVEYVTDPTCLTGARLIIIPGTKNTVHDLLWLHRSGLSRGIKAAVSDGAIVMGICGGFQMLSKQVIDDQGIEGGSPGRYEGLGLLDCVTVFPEYRKRTRLVEGVIVGRGPLLGLAKGGEVAGYEVHMGRTYVRGHEPALLLRDGRQERYDGAVSIDGMIIGTYVHGIFDRPPLRRALMRFLGLDGGEADVRTIWERSIDGFVEVLRRHVNLDLIFSLLGVRR